MSENAALNGAVSLLERSITYLLGNLQLVRASLLAQPTPCADWDLRALLRHVEDSFDALASAAEVGTVGPSVMLNSDDPISGVRDGARRVLGSWSAARPEVRRHRSDRSELHDRGDRRGDRDRGARLGHRPGVRLATSGTRLARRGDARPAAAVRQRAVPLPVFRSCGRGLGP